MSWGQGTDRGGSNAAEEIAQRMMEWMSFAYFLTHMLKRVEILKHQSPKAWSKGTTLT